MHKGKETGPKRHGELGCRGAELDWRTGENRVWDIGFNVSCRKLMLKLGFAAGATIGTGVSNGNWDDR